MDNNITRIAKLKQSQIKIQKLFAFDQKLMQRICSCGKSIYTETWQHLETLEQKTKVGANKTCQLRYCPLCNYYRAKRLTPQIVAVLQNLKDQGKELIFLTLTVPNCDYSELRQTLGRMNKSFAKILTNKDFKNNVTHWIRTTEVTFKGSTAHPHFHNILAVDRDYFKHGNYLRTKDWVKLWSRCYKSDRPLICDARGVKPKRDGCDPIRSAVAELSKYVIKSTDLRQLSCAEMETIHNQLRGLRFIATSRNIKLNEELDTDFDPELWQLIELIFWQWQHAEKSYKQSKIITAL